MKYLRIVTGSALILLASHTFAHGAASQPDEADTDRKIVFPDTAHYKTIVLDPHTHSVFSDGHVWPRIRIGEALRDGLDAIAITEHLEWQPHLEDIPHPDRNRSYDEAASAAEGSDLMVIRGSEITRNAPAGHINAIFINDANDLIKLLPPDDPYDPRAYARKLSQWPAQAAVEAANDQGAFLFWNHPYWARDFPNGIPVIPEFHINNASKGLLHGVEIANGASYSQETFQIALDYDLTLMGVSDVHQLIDWDYKPHAGGHRPVTLVLAEERTQAAIREALFDRRTVVWFKNMLIGRAEHLSPLLQASLQIDSASYPDGWEVLEVILSNHSDANFRLLNRSELTFYTDTDLITVPAHETVKLYVKTPTKADSIELTFDVLNALTAPKEKASITMSTAVDANVSPAE
jgi:3',5'-nucleoside bisphosphate phosphatase